MSRAYRPRLSKDKAVAQRVGAELERELLQGFTVARQMAALGVLDDASTNSSGSTTPTTAVVEEELAAGSAGAWLGISSTPTSASKMRSSLQRASSATTTSKATGRAAAAAAAAGMSTTSPAHVSTRKTRRRGVVGSSLNGSPSLDKGNSSGWSCVSCSFLNIDSAKKCRICSTKNYQPPREPERAREVGTENGEVHGSGIRDPQSRQSGIRERRSFREADDVDASSSGSVREENGVRVGEPSLDIDTDGDGDGATVLSTLVGGRRTDQRKKLRDGASNSFARAGAGGRRSTAAKALVGTARQKADRKRGGLTEEARKRDGAFEHGAASGSTAISLPSRKRAQKRARAQTLASSSSSPVALSLPKDPTGEGCLSSTLSGIVDPLSSDRGCKATSFAHPVAETEEENGTGPPMLRSCRTPANCQLLPSVVTPLTNNEQDQKEGNPRRESATGGAPAASRGGAAAPATSKGFSAGHYLWPTVSRAATLDFSGRRAWEVSSVIVTAGDRRRRGADADKSGSNSASTASVVVCHSGGVSLWGLTATDAVCTHISPALAGATKDNVRGRLCVAAVVGGDVAEVTPSATRAPGGIETCILAIGRHESDPGLPIIRVWHGSLRDTGHLNCNRKVQEMDVCAATPPTVLTTTLKKKFSKYFPPVVPRDVTPCLCVCGYSVTERGHGEKSGDGEVESGEITTVMALGGKAVRLVCATGRSGSNDVRAKALPTGAVACGAVCTSLAPVPANPFLVWASVPSSNAVLLWDVRELQLIVTLPLTASSIYVPAVVLPLSLTMRDDATGEDNSKSLAPTSGSPSFGSLLSLPARRRQRPGERKEARLLCLLATGRGYGDRDAPARHGCTLYGVCRGLDGGAGPHSCSSISAVKLEGGEDSLSLVGGERDTERSQADHDYSGDACVGCLADGHGFIAGVDRHGQVVARNVLTGEAHVLVVAEPKDAIGVASIDCDRSAGMLAVATGGVGCTGATIVDLYALSDAGDNVPGG